MQATGGGRAEGRGEGLHASFTPVVFPTASRQQASRNFIRNGIDAISKNSNFNLK
jgi:hypothetical protein